MTKPLPLDLKPGMYRNGTPYTRRARWTDGNLIRWHDGALRAIGGWVRRAVAGVNVNALVATPSLEAVRDIFAWRDIDQDQQIVFGSNLGIYHLAANGTITDITPGAYTPSNSSKDAVVEAGYGDNPYSVGVYGAANNLAGIDPIPPNRWYLTNYGEILIFGSRDNGSMYDVDPATLTPVVVTNAPSAVQDAVVTAERQVFAIGGGGEPRRVQSSDIENRTVWTPAVDNQCIDRVLEGTGRLLRCIRVGREILILGEADAHVARYIGPPYVTAIDLVAEKCGPIAAEAVAATSRFAVWWGDRTFWIYDGSVQQLPCEVIDYLYDDIEPLQVSKICAFTNTDFSEVWWLYQSQSTTTTEVDSYVVWNYRDNTWNTGRIDRTAGVDKGVLLYPIMVDSSGIIYNHELDDTMPTGDVYAETGAIDIANGERNMAIQYIFPDCQTPSDVTYEIIARQFPNDTEYTYGPYPQALPTPTRALGRSIKLKVNLLTPSAEHGTARLIFAGMGTGKR